MFIELLARDELIGYTDRRMERLCWVAVVVRLLVRYSTKLGSEVTCRVDVTVIDAVVCIIFEIGTEIENPVVETFATDALGLRSGEVVMLRFILLLEEETTVGCRLGVNASEKRVVFTRDVTDVNLSETKVCVPIG